MNELGFQKVVCLNTRQAWQGKWWLDEQTFCRMLLQANCDHRVQARQAPVSQNILLVILGQWQETLYEMQNLFLLVESVNMWKTYFHFCYTKWSCKVSAYMLLALFLLMVCFTAWLWDRFELEWKRRGRIWGAMEIVIVNSHPVLVSKQINWCFPN